MNSILLKAFLFYDLFYCLWMYGKYLSPKDLTAVLTEGSAVTEGRCPWQSLLQLAATPSSHGSHSMSMSIQNNPCSRCNLFCGLHFSKGGIARIFHFLPLLYSFSDERLLGNSELGKMWRMAGPSRLPSRSHRKLFVVTCQVWENAKEKWLHFPLLDTAVLVSIPLYTRILWTKVAVLHPQSPFTSQKCKNPWVKKNASLANNALQQNKWRFLALNQP